MRVSPEAEKILSDIAEIRTARARRLEHDLRTINSQYDLRISRIRREYPFPDPLVPAPIRALRWSRREWKRCCGWIRRLVR